MTNQILLQRSIPTISMRCTAEWASWGPWSTCSDTCGAFGSRQRFRGCDRTHDYCFCPGYFFCLLF